MAPFHRLAEYANARRIPLAMAESHWRWENPTGNGRIPLAMGESHWQWENPITLMTLSPKTKNQRKKNRVSELLYHQTPLQAYCHEDLNAAVLIISPLGSIDPSDRGGRRLRSSRAASLDGEILLHHLLNQSELSSLRSLRSLRLPVFRIRLVHGIILYFPPSALPNASVFLLIVNFFTSNKFSNQGHHRTISNLLNTRKS
jgi:hypothetical protein